jgi:hypothetical protein
VTYVNSFGGDRYYPSAASPDTAGTAQQRPFIANAVGQLVNGKVRATFGPPPPQVAWSVYRITVQGSVSGRAYMYVGDERPENLVSGTNSGTFDENDTGRPYYVPENTPLLIVWQSGTADPAAMARIEYLEI